MQRFVFQPHSQCLQTLFLVIFTLLVFFIVCCSCYSCPQPNFYFSFFPLFSPFIGLLAASFHQFCKTIQYFFFFFYLFIESMWLLCMDYMISVKIAVVFGQHLLQGCVKGCIVSAYFVLLLKMITTNRNMKCDRNTIIVDQLFIRPFA